MERVQKKAILKDLEKKMVLLAGPRQSGKTTLARILINSCDIDPYDVLEVNASRKNKVDDFRDTISNFCMTMPLGRGKVVLLDEAHMVTAAAQAILFNLMETFEGTVRFILTCNYPNKILSPIKSRCTKFHFAEMNRVEFTARAASVLIEEGVEFDLELLDQYVGKRYPDLRETINDLEYNTRKGVLCAPAAATNDGPDYRLEVINLFKSGKIREARQLVCSQIQTEEYDDFYRMLYDNLELWGTEEQQDAALLVIRNAIVNHTLVADPEINLAACLIELSRL
jgi:DNA polymerase III delta prime subunit